jgi:hypothetical protein
MKLLLVTDESSVADAMLPVAELLQASLQIESTITDAFGVAADLILWHAKGFSVTQYNQLHAQCPRIIILVKRTKEWHKGSLSNVLPVYFVVIPFDVEDTAVIIRGSMQGSAPPPLPEP